MSATQPKRKAAKRSRLSSDSAAPSPSLEVAVPAEDVVMSTTKKVKAKAAKGSAGRGVIYLGHLPYGFFENEMIGFFGQFGEVTRLRISRNAKTGRSRHYAFVEFETPEVAKIAAETMDKYMMFDHTLVCKYIEPEDVKANTFHNAHPHKPRMTPWKRIAKETHNKVLTAAEQAQRLEGLLKNDQKRREKLENLGIDYQFPGYEGQVPRKSKRVKILVSDA